VVLSSYWLTRINHGACPAIIDDRSRSEKKQKPAGAVELGANLIMLFMISRKTGKFFRLMRLYFPFIRAKDGGRITNDQQHVMNPSRNPQTWYGLKIKNAGRRS
jgi:hypothetical protein